MRTTGSYDRVEYQYNTQSQQTQLKDQNQTVHDYLFDRMGRQTADIAGNLGADIDDTVRRIGTTEAEKGVRSGERCQAEKGVRNRLLNKQS